MSKNGYKSGKHILRSNRNRQIIALKKYPEN